MTLHDAAITRLSQWWRRNTRTGYGYALGASIHGGPPEFHGVRAVRSMILWAGVLPVAAVAGIWVTRGWSILLLFAVYLAQGVRMVLRNRHSDRRPADVRAMVLFTMLGKFPQLLGVVRFWIDRARGIRGGIIEYKGGPTPTSTAKASVP